jgi:TetR/AcrR family transcriptional repressor of nem operon
MSYVAGVSRAKEFDVDAALAAALDLFWHRGYEATSVNDLVAHLGIGKASMYATFGSKHDLYLMALDQYVRTTDQGIIEELSQPRAALSAVRGLVLRYVDEIINDQQQRGCLVVNAAVERLPGDTAAARRVERSWDTLEVALTLALARAQAAGELAADRDPRAMAQFLLALLQGLRVLGKSLGQADRLRSAAAEGLRTLDPA